MMHGQSFASHLRDWIGSDGRLAPEAALDLAEASCCLEAATLCRYTLTEAKAHRRAGVREAEGLCRPACLAESRLPLQVCGARTAVWRQEGCRDAAAGVDSSSSVQEFRQMHRLWQ